MEFLDYKVMEHIVTETNRFSSQFLDEYIKSLPRISCAQKWYDTNVNEMKPFLLLHGSVSGNGI